MGLTLGAGAGVCNSAPVAAPPCVLGVNGTVAWTFDGTAVSAWAWPDGQWLSGVRLKDPATTCPRVLALDGAWWVPLSDGRWVMLSAQGTVAAEGPLEGTITGAWQGTDTTFVLINGQPPSLLLLSRTKEGWAAEHPTDLAVFPSDRQGTATLRWCCEDGDAPFADPLFILSTEPPLWAERIGTLTLQNDASGQASLHVAFNNNGPHVLPAAIDWTDTIQGNVAALGLYRDQVVVLRDDRQLAAWDLATGWQRRWFTSFDLNLDNARARLEEGKLQLFGADGQQRLPWDTLLTVDGYGRATQWLVHLSGFGSSLTWRRAYEVVAATRPKDGRTDLVLTSRLEAQDKDTTHYWVRPEPSRRVELPLAARVLALLPGGGAFILDGADTALVAALPRGRTTPLSRTKSRPSSATLTENGVTAEIAGHVIHLSTGDAKTTVPLAP